MTTLAPPPWRWTVRSHDDAVLLITRPSPKDTSLLTNAMGLENPGAGEPMVLNKTDPTDELLRIGISRLARLTAIHH